jgi:asparagine synthase (glutamine-hydrolysing)
MCGIAGYIGKRHIARQAISNSLNLLKSRGPDFQSDSKYFFNKKYNINFLHTRLAILDLDKRANQPMIKNNVSLIFNGEIYNFLELKKYLKRRGVNFYTTSDTEVLLNSYIYFGKDFLEHLEGMWSLAICDLNNYKLIISRDRFGEKPLYFSEDFDGCYFSSDIRVIKILSDQSYNLNYKKLIRNLTCGYKSRHQDLSETFYKNIYSLPPSYFLEIDHNLNKKKFKYWSLNSKINNDVSKKEVISNAKDKLFRSIERTIRSDVPISFCLSGGVDSGALASIASKEFNIKINSFSIIDNKDSKYNEKSEIDKVVKDINSSHNEIIINNLDNKKTLDDLTNLILYKSAPLPTTTSFLYFNLAKQISNKGFKVSISGAAADEIFSGYYDHYLQHLFETRDSKNYNVYLKDFNSLVKKYIRDKNLKDPNLYIKNQKFRDHIFDSKEIFVNFLNPKYKKKKWFKFSEKKYSNNFYSNRRLNELFNEITPVILMEDDSNSMYYSIENRSPYLDKDLVEYMFSVNPEMLIENGFTKNILREISKGYLVDDIRLNRNKKGFNGSVTNIFDFKDKNFINDVFEKDSEIYHFFNKKKILELLNKNISQNNYSKFIFSFISTKIFLDSHN